ncbi:MAG: hypothetical protein AABZ28_06520 [Nitrospinota bacterium]
MKKILGLFLVALFVTSLTGVAIAGPSRAIIQELGSVVKDGEVNVDLDWLSQKLNVIAAGDTTVGQPANNGTIGGIGLSSVNIGISENYELRLGRLPGIRSYIGYPVGNASNNGLSLKVGGLAPGLGLWLGYGSTTLKDANSANTAGDTEGSSMTLGAAYTTTAGAFIVNGELGYSSDSASAAGVSAKGTTSLEIGLAGLYPLKESILVGIEILSVTTTVADTADVGVLVPALGARVIPSEHWTIDASVAYLGGSVTADTKPTDTLKDSAGATIFFGVPNLRVNYKF